MSSQRPYIGINQRVPVVVLENAICRFLETGTVDREAITQDLKEHTQGTNRLHKAVTYAYLMLTRPQVILEQVRQTFTLESYMRLPKADRNALMLSLLAFTYPIAYDVVVAYATGFNVQPLVSRRYLNDRISASWGSTRTIDIALKAVVPMLIELEVVRYREGHLFAPGETTALRNPTISELFIYTDISASAVKSISLQELRTRPWYKFFKPSYQANQGDLLNYREVVINDGYLSLESKQPRLAYA